MNKAFSKIGILVIAVALLAGGLWLWGKNQTPIEPVISGNATVRFVALEGGFYGLEGDDGKKYDPVNLAEEFQKDGLRVKFEAREKKDAVSFRMWGQIVEIAKIEKLTDEENAAWKTYENETYGFSLQYPPSSTFVELVNAESLLPPFEDKDLFRVVFKSPEFLISVMEKPQESLKSYLDKIVGAMDKLGKTSAAAYGAEPARAVKVNGQGGFEIISGDASVFVHRTADTFLERGDYLYSLEYNYSAYLLETLDPDEKIKYDTLQKMLSTFRFTE